MGSFYGMGREEGLQNYHLNFFPIQVALIFDRSQEPPLQELTSWYELLEVSTPNPECLQVCARNEQGTSNGAFIFQLILNA